MNLNLNLKDKKNSAYAVNHVADSEFWVWRHSMNTSKCKFDRDNASATGPIRKGEYQIVNGRLIMTGGSTGGDINE